MTGNPVGLWRYSWVRINQFLQQGVCSGDQGQEGGWWNVLGRKKKGSILPSQASQPASLSRLSAVPGPSQAHFECLLVSNVWYTESSSLTNDCNFPQYPLVILDLNSLQRWELRGKMSMVHNYGSQWWFDVLRIVLVEVPNLAHTPSW